MSNDYDGLRFPPGFVFGTACSAYQCEGASAEDGRGPSIWDDFCRVNGSVKSGDSGAVACDSYHRLNEDISIAKSIGGRAHRFSVSWPRIQPDGRGAVNEKGLDYYERKADALLEAGLEPWITLYHWDLPSALQEKGGWQNRDTARAFADFAYLVARRLDGRARRYMPVNEPQCVAMLGYGTGEHAPGLQLGEAAVAGVLHELTVAHSLADDALRAAASAPVSVGTVTCGRLCYPRGSSGEAAAYDASFAPGGGWAFTHSIFLDSLFFGRYSSTAPESLRAFEESIPDADWALMRRPDFLGVNVYNGTPVDVDGRELAFPADMPRTAMGWPVTPEVLYYGPRQLYKRYAAPLVVTENGISCRDRMENGQVRDKVRIEYMYAYLRQLNRAIAAGTPVEGYFYWSLLDNFEWAEGYSQRFGLSYVDYESQKRVLKDSARWYTGLIESQSR